MLMPRFETLMSFMVGFVSEVPVICMIYMVIVLVPFVMLKVPGGSTMRVETRKIVMRTMVYDYGCWLYYHSRWICVV